MARRLPLLLLALAGLVLGLAAAPAGAAVPATPDDSEFSRQSGLKAIKAPEAWAKSTGAGARVAVVSTGIAPHPDLAGKIDAGFDATGADDATLDIGGRGTHLAGIVGAVTNNGAGIAGTAPDARVLPYRAFSRDDGSIDGDAYIRALSEARAAPIVLVDLPSGFPSDKVPDLQQALKALGNGGISVVVGVQSGISLAGLPVLAVAPTAAQAGAQGVAAPGSAPSTSVKSVLGVAPEYGYDEASGSNRSAAFAAGAVAILRVLGADAARAADLLRRTKTADGTIDVAAAVAALTAPPPPPATTTTTKKPEATTTTKPSTLGFGQPAGGPGGVLPVLPGDLVEPGEEAAVPPPGLEAFLDEGGDSGGSTSLLGGGEEDDRPLGALAVGFGLLCGVGTGLSLTLRRMADAPL